MGDEPLPVTVLYAPGLEGMAKELAKELESDYPAVCTDSLSDGSEDPAVSWEHFPSGDPNIKVSLKAVQNRHVVFLMNSDKEMLFEQLSLLLFLQRFHEPHPLPEYAKKKWKSSMADSKYNISSAAGITVVIPWYRHCQMERTSRWARSKGKWTNADPEGGYLDVPTALQFAALLSAPPILAGPLGGPQALPLLPKKQLLLLDIHEYEDLEMALAASGAWANRPVPYNRDFGTGTFFASAFDSFLQDVFLPERGGNASSVYVVFPDFGAHRRFCAMVMRACGMKEEQVLWIPKSRVGADIQQTDGLMFLDSTGVERLCEARFSASSHILLADDFTNSGSTLFGGAAIIRRHAEPGAHVAAFVSHFVGKYNRSVVAEFVATLYNSASGLDTFYCTDSVAQTVSWLKEEMADRRAKDEPERCRVMSLAKVIAKWVVKHPLAVEAPPPVTESASLFRDLCGIV